MKIRVLFYFNSNLAGWVLILVFSQRDSQTPNCLLLPPRGRQMFGTVVLSTFMWFIERWYLMVIQIYILIKISKNVYEPPIKKIFIIECVGKGVLRSMIRSFSLHLHSIIYILKKSTLRSFPRRRCYKKITIIIISCNNFFRITKITWKFKNRIHSFHRSLEGTKNF